MQDLKEIGEIDEQPVIPKLHKIRCGNADRSFMWPLEVYKEWYEYEVLNGLMIDFDDWFDYTLFAEPLKAEAVTIKSHKNNKLTLEVDLTFDLHRILRKLTNIVTSKSEENLYTDSRAVNQPSPNIRINTITKQREVYALKKYTKKTNLQIALEVGLIDKNATETQVENAVRTIQKMVKRVDDILQNVKTGVFP